MDQCAIRPVTVRPSQFFQHIRVSQLHNSTWNPFSCWFKNYTTTWNYNIFIFILKVLWPTTKALAIPYPCAELSEPVSEQVSLVDEGQYWLTVTPVLNFCIFNTSEHIKPLQPVGQAAEFRFEYTPQGPSYVLGATTNSRAEVRRSFITTTVLDESQVTPQGRHKQQDNLENLKSFKMPASQCKVLNNWINLISPSQSDSLRFWQNAMADFCSSQSDFAVFL